MTYTGAVAAPVPSVKPYPMWKIALGVFLGLLAYSVVATTAFVMLAGVLLASAGLGDTATPADVSPSQDTVSCLPGGVDLNCDGLPDQ